ncbi:phage tail protein [Enterobacter roggenkampii]|uniref:phage tail protein n=1 Tax=Enterobacter roggenkampii TaxID=1812935 RepID=UPI002FF72260
MTAKYFAILTSQGAAKLANATALGTKLNLTQMAVGDGNGTLPTPDPAQTRLLNQKRIAPLNMLTVDPANTSQIIAEQIIPENEGGFWIREIGLYDDAGVLIAVANCPETYKPQLQEGSGRTQTIRMILIVSSTEAVTLKIDPSVVLATRKYVDDKVIEVKAYADALMAAHLAAADPHSQYAPKASPALTGTPNAPTPVKTDNTTRLATTAHVKQVVADYAPLANPALTGKPTAPTAAQTSNDTQLATTAFVKDALAALVDSSPEALDTLNELAAALGDDPNFAATMTAELARKMDKARNGADIPDVAAFLNNLGLGTVATKNVGTGTGQIPDMSSFNTGNTSSFRLPTGHFVQVGSGQTISGGFTQSYPTPFPNICQALIGVVYSTLGVRAFIATNTSDRTAANMNVVDQNGNGINVTVGYIAIGR